MASCRMLFRSSLFLSDPRRPFLSNLESISSSSSSSSSSLRFSPAVPPRLSSRARVRVRVFHRAVAPLKCSHGEIGPPPQPQDDQGPPQEAILKAISGESLSILLLSRMFGFVSLREFTCIVKRILRMVGMNKSRCFEECGMFSY